MKASEKLDALEQVRCDEEACRVSTQKHRKQFSVAEKFTSILHANFHGLLITRDLNKFN